MLTQRRQQQALADLIQGLEPNVSPEQLAEPYLTLWREVCQLLDLNYDRHDIHQELARLRLREDDPRLTGAIDIVLTLEPGHQPSYATLAELGPDLAHTTWLWPQWIPRGQLTLLAAWPGVGKTYLALDLARRVTAGLPAPDDQPLACHTGVVVFVDAEDFLPDVYERALAWQMDLTRFYPIRRPPRDLIDLSEPVYQDPLIERCTDLRPDLVIIDSLSLVNARGENNIEDIRDVLGFLVELAQFFDLALLLIHHLRKPGRGLIQPVTMHDLRGSGHLVAMARSILSLDIQRLGPEDDPNGPRQLRVLKKNRGKYPRPLAVQYHAAPDNPDVAVLEYGPLAQFFANPPESLTTRCAEWLIDLLEELGPLPFQTVIDLAAEAGFKRGVVIKARQSAGERIADTKGTRVAGNRWTVVEEGETEEVEQTKLADQCAVWLLDVLAAKPLSYRELVELGAVAGFKENVLQVARKRCPQIIDTLGPRRQGNKWALVE